MRAKTNCPINLISGLENVTLLPQRRAVDAAPTTDARVDRVNELDAKQTMLGDIMRTYGKLKIDTRTNIDIKSAIMSNLIDIHLGLLSTSEILQKRVPMMYKNCMKAQPGVPCPKP